MSTITQLEYLVALDKEKHFGKAAKECHVSQPSLSAQIQKLEEELDVIIFDRSKKPIMTTEIGKEIIAQAKVVIKEYKRIKSLAGMNRNEPRGEFHLAVIPTLAPYLIPLFLGEFSRKYPQVKLKINEYKTGDIIKHLVNDEIDAGLLVTPLGDERLIERHLFFEPFYAYISKDHQLARKKSLSELDLENTNLWLLEEGHCFREQMLKLCALDRKGPVLSNIEFAGGNLETLKNLVKKNAGLTLLPELAVNDLSEEEFNEHVRKLAKPTPTREVSLVYGRSFLKEAVIKAMEETIIAALPKKIKSLKRENIDVVDIY